MKLRLLASILMNQFFLFINHLRFRPCVLFISICVGVIQTSPASAQSVCRVLFGETQGETSLHESLSFIDFLDQLHAPERFNRGGGQHLYRGSGKVDYGADQITSYLFNDIEAVPRASSFRIAIEAKMKAGVSFQDTLPDATMEIQASIQQQLLEKSDDLKKFVWNQMNRSVINLPMSKRSADVLFAEAGRPETGSRYGMTSLQMSMRDHPGQTGLVEIFDIDPSHLAVMKGESSQEYLVFGDLPAQHVFGLFVGVPGDLDISRAGMRWKYVRITERDLQTAKTTELAVYDVETTPNPNSIDGELFHIKTKVASFRDREKFKSFIRNLTGK